MLCAVRPFLVILLGLTLGNPQTRAQEGEHFLWDAGAGRVSVAIEDWDLTHVLERIAAATGWEIRYEPELKHTVSAKFSDLDQTDALRRLFGQLNFALVVRGDRSGELSVFRDSIQRATARVLSAPEKGEVNSEDAGPIPNQLIVTLDSGSDVNMEALAARLGARIVGQIEERGAYLLEFTDAEAAAAARSELEVLEGAEVDANFRVPVPVAPELVALGPAAPPLRLRPGSATPDGQTIIGLIDTAVAAEGATKGFLLPEMALAGETLPAGEVPSHGTAMASTLMQGVALAYDGSGESNVRILPIDVYGNAGATSTFLVADAMVSAVNQGADVINLSLGGPDKSPFMEDLVREMHDRGVLVMAAAGNEPSTAPNYPAAYPEAIAVTAGERNGQIADYANRGEFVDVAAPGVSVVTYRNHDFLITGTSPATASVSGLAAGIAERFQKSPAEIEAHLRESLAVPTPVPVP